MSAKLDPNATLRARSENERYVGGAGFKDARPSRLWLWFVAAFVIQAAAWTAWFTIAAENKVQEVPLVKATGDKV